MLAIRLFYRGDLVDAARLFNEVLEQRRASILPHLYLASIYRELGKDSLALYHMDAASRISPQDPYLHLQKAVILLSQGDKAGAAAEIRSGTQLLKSTVSPRGIPGRRASLHHGEPFPGGALPGGGLLRREAPARGLR